MERLFDLLRGTAVADADALIHLLELNLPGDLLPEETRRGRVPTFEVRDCTDPSLASCRDRLWAAGPFEIEREPLVVRVSGLVRRLGVDDAEALVRIVETRLPDPVFGDLLAVLVAEGRCLNAILLHRHRTGATLGESKAFV